MINAELADNEGIINLGSCEAVTMILVFDELDKEHRSGRYQQAQMYISRPYNNQFMSIFYHQFVVSYCERGMYYTAVGSSRDSSILAQSFGQTFLPSNSALRGLSLTTGYW